ncbi:hypothetical protein CDV52_14790 [Haematobacter missouriensis]|uniref:Uncharacterized protein n=1 Tax=Haematobacter missouriensis TaxID=366616 RepID=A0A212ALM0_9RHOB|nr:hypothetical protein CDV52_14790 [Haematobacter missouriensis]
MAEDQRAGALRRLGATASLNFLPLPTVPSFLASQESPASAVTVPGGTAPAVVPGLSIAIEAAMERART